MKTYVKNKLQNLLPPYIYIYRCFNEYIKGKNNYTSKANGQKKLIGKVFEYKI